MSELFNNSGVLNASSVKDAISQLVKVAAMLEDNQPTNIGLVGQPNMTDKQRDEMIARAIMTNDGKYAMAQQMANPIRKNLDYQGIARRLVVPDALAQGDLPTYDRDIDVAATVVSSNGAAPESRVFGERITVPTWEIVSYVTARIAEVRRRRFNVIDRAVQKARQEIMAIEDANIFAAVDAAAEDENTAQDISDAGLQKRDLVAIKAQIDRWDLVTAKFYMNIVEFTDILNWGSGGGQGPGGGEIDPVSQREILHTGLFAKVWGSDIMVSKIVPQGTVYGAADPEFVGVMPIRQGIEVIPADEPRELKLGWVVSEEIGLAIVNARGVAKGVKSLVND